jgi:hypothetical protein
MKKRQFDICRASLLRLPSLLMVDQVYHRVNKGAVEMKLELLCFLGKLQLP